MKQTVKKANYRQSVWKEIETGDVYLFYGNAGPEERDKYTHMYTQDVEEVIITTPVEDAAT